MSAAPEPVYQLAHLESWPHAAANWPAGGTALAVIGHPVAHSVSPAMHNAALAELAKADPRFARWRYFKFDIAPDELPAALQRFHEREFLGLNLTVPHKALVVEQLAAKDEFVRDAGAANTLKREGSGWRGHNTDGTGLAAALREDLAVNLPGTPVILLGAGGAARAAAVECLRGQCSSLWVANRTEARRDALLELLRPLAAGIPLEGFDPGRPPTRLPVNAVLINATSSGLTPTDPAPIDLRRLPAGLKVFDMIYNPPLTPLLRQASGLGLAHANGLSMLVHQGARSLEIWTGKSLAPAVVRLMKTAAQEALAAH
jgi:shikimate dehydrogenase